MANRILLILASLALLLSGASRAKADAVLYSNGSLDGNVEFLGTAWTINSGFSVTDSFTVTSTSTLTQAQVGLWAIPGDTPLSVDWSIGTSAFGSDKGSGMGALTNTFQFTNGFGYDIYESTFPLSGTLPAGTYWLTLQNGAVSPGGDPLYWDQNSGPSSAFENTIGSIPSEFFQIYGTGSVAVPEPSTLALLGIIGLGVAGYRWRRRDRSRRLPAV